MSRGYARAFVDRAATSDKPGDGPIRFVAATEGRKADGIDLRMSGADLAMFEANPVILYAHTSYGRDSLPIGRATESKIDGTRLLIDVEYDADDEFAQKVERKYRSGYMSAGSIGFDVDKWESPNDNYWSGGVAVEWSLREFSMVPVGMDKEALVESGRALDTVDRALLRALAAEFGADRVLAVLSGKTPEIVVPVPSPPPADVVNQDAARGLIAALTLS